MNLNGTYRGFSTTSDSDVGIGELEVIIDDETIRIRLATGRKIEKGQVSRSELRELSSGEVATHFLAKVDSSEVRGYQLGEKGPTFLFFPEVPNMPEVGRVLVQGFIGEDAETVFGSCYLFTADQVAAGYLDQAIADIEADNGDPGIIPRLANNGLRG